MKRTQQRLPARRRNVIVEPTSPLSLALRAGRIDKQIPQRVIAEALSEKCGGDSTNVRVSTFELGKKLPTDAELTVIGQVLGLSVASLRQLRDASRGHVKETGKALYAAAIAAGQKTLKGGRQPAVAAPKAKAKPVAVPALADLVEQIDEIAPMPVDKDARRRWFSCVSELSRIGAAS